MTPWLVLVPASVLFLIGSVYSYRADLRNGTWFMPVYVAVSIGCALLWVWAARSLDDKNKIYFLCLAWDLLMICCYYLIPLVVFEFRFNRWVLVGVGMMIAGLMIVKLKGEI